MVRWPVAVVALAVFLVGCSSTAKVSTESSGARTADPCPCGHSAVAKVVVVTPVFRAAGTNIEIELRATREGEWQWDWDKFVLTAPDGSKHVARREPNTSPLVDVDGTFTSSATFVFDVLAPGLYDLDYDGFGLSRLKV